MLFFGNLENSGVNFLWIKRFFCEDIRFECGVRKIGLLELSCLSILFLVRRRGNLFKCCRKFLFIM